jgi:hypothetical protein
MQLRAEVHDTPDSLASAAWAGCGVGWMRQWVPFHCSARALVAEMLLLNPTAVQALADAHDTPLRKLSASAAGLGMGWMAQRAPFQRSANGANSPVPVM